MSYQFNACITRELYYNETSNYGIYAVISDTELPHTEGIVVLGQKQYHTTIVGNVQRLAIDNTYKIDADLVENKKYGWQFKIKNASKDIPKTIDETRDYLLSILTESQTDILLDKYPDIVNNIVNC